jgi:hypothetical protein
MLRWAFILIVVTSVFLSGTSVGESINKPIEMPEGFEGICLGMSIKEFLEVRPNANMDPMDRDTPDQAVDLSKENQSLKELVKNDPLYNLTMLGSYVFRDSRLKKVSLVWGGDLGEISKYRTAFVSSCSKMWGDNFQRKVMKQNPGTKKEQLVPLLLWEKENIRIAATCTSEYEDENPKEGAFMISLFSMDNKEAMATFAGEKVSKDIQNKLFEEIIIEQGRSRVVFYIVAFAAAISIILTGLILLLKRRAISQSK